MRATPNYPVTTSLKEELYLKQRELREQINPSTNKKFTLADIIQAGVEGLYESAKQH